MVIKVRCLFVSDLKVVDTGEPPLGHCLFLFSGKDLNSQTIAIAIAIFSLFQMELYGSIYYYNNFTFKIHTYIFMYIIYTHL